MSHTTRYKFKIGDWVTIIGTGNLRGMVVDYYNDVEYVVAFRSGKEFVFHKSLLVKTNEAR